MIRPSDMVNCATTNTLRGSEASLPVLNDPFKTFTGSKEDK